MVESGGARLRRKARGGAGAATASRLRVRRFTSTLGWTSAWPTSRRGTLSGRKPAARDDASMPSALQRPPSLTAVVPRRCMEWDHFHGKITRCIEAIAALLPARPSMALDPQQQSPSVFNSATVAGDGGNSENSAVEFEDHFQVT